MSEPTSLLDPEAITDLPPVDDTPTPWTTDDGSFPEAWVGKLPADLQEHKSTFEKFKSVPELSRSYLSLQQLLGKKANAVLIPTEKSTPEEVASYRKALGIPEAADKYEIEPGDLPEGVQVNPENLAKIKDWAFSNNVKPAALKSLVEELMIPARINEFSQTKEQLEQQAFEQRQEHFASLRKEFGVRMPQEVELVGRVVNGTGTDPQSFGFSDPNVVVALSRIIKLLGEDKIPQATEKNSSNPGAVADEIVNDKNHPMHTKWANGDPETNKYVLNLRQRAEAMGLK